MRVPAVRAEQLHGGFGQRLGIPGTHNLRDLGGCPVSGGTLRSGRLLRSELLAGPGAGEAFSTWDESNAVLLADLGIRTVIDLRSRAERQRTPAMWPEATGARTVLAEIPEGGEGSDHNFLGDLLEGRRTAFTVEDLGQYNVTLLDRRAGAIGRAIATLADPEAAPAVVHCSAGKDRTGLVIAVLLLALGTPRQVVVRDYALTGRFRPGRAALYGRLFDKVNVRTSDVSALFETPPAAMETGLDHLVRTYGGARQYLLDAAGLSADTLDAVFASLVEPGVSPAPRAAR